MASYSIRFFLALIAVAALVVPAAGQSLEEVRQYINQGNLEAAERTAERIVAANPADAVAWYLLGISRTGLGQMPGAIAAYREAVSIQPGFADAWNNLGNLLRRSGNLDGAEAALTRALEADPDNGQASLNAGMVSIQLRQFREAIDRLERAEESMGEQFLITYSLARAWIELAERERAGPYLERLRESPPPGFSGFLELSTLLNQHGAFVPSAELLSSVPEGGRSPEMLLRLGQAWFGLDRLVEAHDTFSTMVAASPQSVDGHLWRGYAARGIGKHAEAFEELETALLLDPRSSEALLALGTLTLETGDDDEAIAWFDRALALDPDNVATRIEKAVALGRLDRHEEVISILVDLPEDDSPRHRALYLLARAYRQVGNKTEADSALERFRLLDRKIREAEGRATERPSPK